MSEKASFHVKLTGHPAANRDAKVTLRNTSTNQIVERSPFLDGSLLVRDLDPGLYEIEVNHPNLVTPIEKKVVRLFPQVIPTLVPIPVRPDLFRDTPIRDIPDADVGPVQQAIAAARSSLVPVAQKSPGEVIRASDWNVLAGAVTDLASAVLELTNLVSPRGHDHPEIAEKVGEVQDNLRNFVESFGRSLLELRREIETEQLRKNVDDVLTRHGAPPEVKTNLLGKFDDLAKLSLADSRVFTQKLAVTGNQVLEAVNRVALTQPDAAVFLADPNVKELTLMSQHYAEAGVQTKATAELDTYRRTSSATAGSKFAKAIGPIGI